MTKEEILKYVMETPMNTNAAILLGMLDQLVAGATDNLTDTSDGTATAADIVKGKVAYAKGQKIMGNHTDLNTNDATAIAGDIKTGKTAYANGKKITGTLVELNTNDADATAADIVKGKVAYVKGKRIVGTLEVIPH